MRGKGKGEESYTKKRKSTRKQENGRKKMRREEEEEEGKGIRRKGKEESNIYLLGLSGLPTGAPPRRQPTSKDLWWGRGEGEEEKKGYGRADLT